MVKEPVYLSESDCSSSTIVDASYFSRSTDGDDYSNLSSDASLSGSTSSRSFSAEQLQPVFSKINLNATDSSLDNLYKSKQLEIDLLNQDTKDKLERIEGYKNNLRRIDQIRQERQNTKTIKMASSAGVNMEVVKPENIGKFDITQALSADCTDLESVFVSHSVLMTSLTNEEVKFYIECSGRLKRRIRDTKAAFMIEKKITTKTLEIPANYELKDGLKVFVHDNPTKEMLTYNKLFAIFHKLNENRKIGAISPLASKLNISLMSKRFVEKIHPIMGAGYQFYGKLIKESIASGNKKEYVDGDLGLYCAGMLFFDYMSYLNKSKGNSMQGGMASSAIPCDLATFKNCLWANENEHFCLKQVTTAMGLRGKEDIVLSNYDVQCFMEATETAVFETVSKIEARVASVADYLINGIKKATIREVKDAAKKPQSNDTDDHQSDDQSASGYSGLPAKPNTGTNKPFLGNL